MNVRPALPSSMRVSYATDVVPDFSYFNTDHKFTDGFIKPGHFAGYAIHFMAMGLVTMLDDIACIPVRAIATGVGLILATLGAALGLLCSGHEGAVNGFIGGMDLAQGLFQINYCTAIGVMTIAGILLGVAVGITVGGIGLAVALMDEVPQPAQ